MQNRGLGWIGENQDSLVWIGNDDLLVFFLWGWRHAREHVLSLLNFLDHAFICDNGVICTNHPPIRSPLAWPRFKRHASGSVYEPFCLHDIKTGL
jgi:hypothetical protein